MNPPAPTNPAVPLTLLQLPYCADSDQYFLAIRSLPHPIWLDSGHLQGQFGRYDILVAAPEQLMQTVAGVTTLTKDGQQQVSDRNPFELLAEAMAELPVCQAVDLPFTGGAVGFWGYNLRLATEPSLSPAKRDIELPDMQVGIYAWALIQDHQTERSYLVANGLSKQRLAEITALLEAPSQTTGTFSIDTLQPQWTEQRHGEAFDRIQAYIKAGDCYQVNLAQRFAAPYRGDPLAAYLALRKQLPSPFSAYLDFPGGALLSFSPERFLQLSNRQVETRPIKGTAPRGTTAETDKHNAQQLLHSQKDRAENLMIVDLLRNDLSKVCKLGSVATPALFELESFANVHHLVSRVTGRLQAKYSATELLRACFPGGSITGAPKIRAMEIIEELEPVERSVYCGSIGYISSNGRMDTNIAIRTLVCDRERLYCWGGGGIVADSEAASEYQESLTKVGVLLEGLKAFNPC